MRSIWSVGFRIQYTVATKSTVAKTGDSNSRLSPIRSTLLPILATNRQQLEFDSLSRSTLSPSRSTTGPKRHGRLCRLSAKSTMLNSTLSPVCTGLNIYVLKVADITEDGSRGRRDDGQRQTEAETLHAQFARDAREVVAYGS